MKSHLVWIGILSGGTAVALAFRIQTIERLGTNRVRLTWNSTTGVVYGVERTLNLTQSFAPVVSNLPATPPLNVLTDALPAKAPAAFYRVKATIPESHGWQHAHDAQRTGYVPAAPPHPWRWAWQWNGSDASGRPVPGKVLLPRNVQPIVAEGRVYIAAGTNGIYGLNETNGAVLWQVQPGGAINSTPAYDPGTRALFAVSSNGRLYKLDPSTGSTIASCVLGAPSPLPLPVAVSHGRLWASMGPVSYTHL
ncbi:MAG: PQQ-binding-like beta-propeller repeat protein, partial [Limisphaera sp.]|nr:PQQ-binding-like beta-propeller repeat protein [Limisphaera sp.]